MLNRPIRLESLLLTSAAMGLALAVIAPYRTAEAADLCNAASVTISTAQAGSDNCILDAGQSISLTAFGSIAHAGGDGILVQNVAGSIVNAGTLSSAVDDGIDINPTGSLSGGIDNSGTVTGADIGISISGSVASGLTNSGTITGTGSDGVRIFGATGVVTGGLVNQGTINAGNDGITLDNSASITGGITNAVGALIDAAGDGVFIDDTAVLNGSLLNAGTIDAGDDGIALSTSATVNGSIQNSGTITAGDDGIELSNGNTTNGSIVNSGTITAGGSGMEIQSNAIITGNITNGGAISAGNDGIFFSAGSLGGSIENDGTITAGSAEGIEIAGSATVSGSITNSGTITASASDGVRVAGTSTLTGTIQNSGTITAGNFGVFVTSSTVGGITNNAGGTITGSTNSIKIISSTAPITVTNAGVLDGDVGLDDGTLNLNGSAARVDGDIGGLGSSTVNVNGDFTTEGGISVGTLAVAAPGKLTLANNVTVTSVTNAGSIAIADGASRTITGGYAQSGGGRLETGATSSSSFGRLAVSGTADFSGSDALHVTVGTGTSITSGDQFQNVVQAGSLTATSVTVTDSSALLSFAGVVDGNTIDLTAASTQSIQTIIDAGGTKKSGGGAGAVLDAIIAGGPSGDMQTVINSLYVLSTNQEIEDAVQKLLPAVTGGHAQGNLAVAEAGANNVVHDRLTRLSGLNAGGLLLADPVAWVKPFAADTAQGARGGVSGFDGLTIGTAMGVDGQYAEDLRLGAAFSYADARIDGRGAADSNVDIDTYQIIGYGTYKLDGKTHVNALGALGWNDNDSRRVIDFGGLNRTAEGDYDSWHATLDVELVRSYKLSEHLGLMPSLSASYTYASADGYNETGAGAANLDVDDADADSLNFAASGRLVYGVTEGINLSGNLGLTYDVLAGDDQVTATFQGGGNAFVTESLDPAPFGFTGGVGLELVPESGIDASLNYDIEARDDFRNHKVQLNLRIPF